MIFLYSWVWESSLKHMKSFYSAHRHNGTQISCKMTQEIICDGLFWPITPWPNMVTPISVRGKIQWKIWNPSIMGIYSYGCAWICLCVHVCNNPACAGGSLGNYFYHNTKQINQPLQVQSGHVATWMISLARLVCVLCIYMWLCSVYCVYGMYHVYVCVCTCLCVHVCGCV